MSVLIFCEGGVVQDVEGIDDFIIIDRDNLESGICPVCSRSINDGKCEDCELDWYVNVTSSDIQRAWDKMTEAE